MYHITHNNIHKTPGTALLESLSVCSDFSTHQSQPVYTTTFPNVTHTDILSCPDAFAAFSRVIAPDSTFANVTPKDVSRL